MRIVLQTGPTLIPSWNGTLDDFKFRARLAIMGSAVATRYEAYTYDALDRMICPLRRWRHGHLLLRRQWQP